MSDVRTVLKQENEDLRKLNAELLEALIEAANVLPGYIETIENNMDASLNYGKKVLAKIRQAIAKAKGE